MDAKRRSISERVAHHYDALAPVHHTEAFGKRGYYRELELLIRHLVASGQRVLEVGCGSAQTLCYTEPSYGVGIDLSPRMVEQAENRCGEPGRYRFVVGDVCQREVFEKLDEKFDVILAVGVIQELADVQAFLENVRHCATPETRLVIVGFSRLWQLPVRLAEALGWKHGFPIENWLPPQILKDLLFISGWEPVQNYHHLICPVSLGPVSRFLNRYVGHIPPLNTLSMLNCVVARPVELVDAEARPEQPSWSVVIPCRNEAGHIEELHQRMPELPAGSEVIWIEGNSSDDTEAVLRELVATHPERPYRFLKQRGRGKGDAVRQAFAEARGDLLIILDADVSVPPEDVPKFARAVAEGRAEFVNGTRLVYPMDKRAMRFLNLAGNRGFAMILGQLLRQSVSDTLCGTKVLWRRDWERLLRLDPQRAESDPFGDFALLFGAAHMHLKIRDLPIRYAERKYGDTNISRFSDGWRLLRMVRRAARELYWI